MNYNISPFNGQPQITVPVANLRVTPYKIEELLAVKIHQKINEHAMLHLKGILVSTQEERYIEFSATGINIALSVVDSSGEDYIIFQGVVKETKIYVERDTHYIEVQAVSYSYLMDVEKKSRSFQNKKMLYTDLIKQVTGDYPDSDVIDTASNGAPTNKFIIQHQTTDWEFVKRLASHFNTGLVCDIRFDSPKYFFGIPVGQTLELDSENYTVKKDMQRFNLLSQNGVDGISEQDFISYEIETNCIVRVGDTIVFQGKKLCVSEITSVADKGIFVSHLVVMPKKGLNQLYIPNSNIVGVSFSGHILESKNDQVKVSLDIDHGYDPGDPCFFPYSTIYSSQSGSGWYCMPETGDTVRIYCPDGEDDHAYAISSVHEQVDPALQHKAPSGSRTGSAGGGASGSAGGYSGQRDDPSIKSLVNSAGMEIRLTPDGIYIISDGASITMLKNGIEIQSDNDITFTSQQNIIMDAGLEVNITGDTEVTLASESSTVSMTDDVSIVGQEVKAN
ncbi:MAG: phage late control D family protein [Clostridiales bacterium]|jgi:hypothetical protein|nr:phage late control D family protein [Clostridiales bacterium]